MPHPLAQNVRASYAQQLGQAGITILIGGNYDKQQEDYAMIIYH